MSVGSGFRAKRGLVAVLVLIGAALAAMLGDWGAGSPAGGGRVGAPPQVEARGPEDRAWGPAVGFANRDRLDEHYRKHGAEFGDISRQDYLRQAQALRDAPVGGPILEAVRRDGVVSRFDRRSGAFIAFNSNGVIRTFFRPNDGERYFRRQLERDH
ncbi:hypothetical protein FHP25_19700 [Vineibacter terrae]|uniref:Uncharacterized protein n=1 Tax=Vineibacter terrae TaxID=2586908 RepID=A0A5C8PJ88_9HYPH|nr:hypothetical protein [Vineibacter terrae]TXL73877.1 hypothetical protein FHP25_19700 [Vineibacter terrae]